jgi:ABC-type antimicrobial peptide transport system permease subunit
MNPFVRDWKGWISMAVSIAIIVFAHKNFKDSGDGFMSYGQGLGIAFIAVMTSVLVGFVFSYLYINFFDPTVMDEVWEKALEDAQAKGQNEEAAQMGIEWGKKLFWLFYLIGGAFVALIVGLLVPIFTQKKNPEPFV